MNDAIVNDMQEKILAAIQIGFNGKDRADQHNVVREMIKALCGSSYEAVKNFYVVKERTGQLSPKEGLV